MLAELNFICSKIIFNVIANTGSTVPLFKNRDEWIDSGKGEGRFGVYLNVGVTKTPFVRDELRN